MASIIKENNSGSRWRCAVLATTAVIAGTLLVHTLLLVQIVVQNGSGPTTSSQKGFKTAQEFTYEAAPQKSLVFVFTNETKEPYEHQLRVAGLWDNECDCPLLIIGDSARLASIKFESVKAIVFEIRTVKSNGFALPFLNSIPEAVPKILYWREAVYGNLDERTQTRFDFIMGTHFTDATLNPCHYPSGFQNMLPIYENYNRSRLIGTMSSHCNTTLRDPFIKELQKHLPVEQYGRCSNQNTNLATPRKGAPAKDIKAFYSNFKFFLQVENTDSDGYVSEKIFNTLGTGAIPVYLGARDIHNFPSLDGESKWFINARDFPSAEALAAYVLAVASSEELYRHYLQWHAYAKAGGIWMPNAPPNMKECFALKTEFGSAYYHHRKAAICSLCDDRYLGDLQKRGLKTIKVYYN